MSLKLLPTIEPGTVITVETLEQFFFINQTQIQYLQNEQRFIFVNSQFDITTSKLFRALQRTLPNFRTAMGTLRSAASLSAAAKPPASTASRQYSTYNSRGQYRGGPLGGFRN